MFACTVTTAPLSDISRRAVSPATASTGASAGTSTRAGTGTATALLPACRAQRHSLALAAIQSVLRLKPRKLLLLDLLRKNQTNPNTPNTQEVPFYFPPSPAQLPLSLPAGMGRAWGAPHPPLPALGTALRVAQEFLTLILVLGLFVQRVATPAPPQCRHGVPLPGHRSPGGTSLYLQDQEAKENDEKQPSDKRKVWQEIHCHFQPALPRSRSLHQ